jgi:hypothetical protein
MGIVVGPTLEIYAIVVGLVVLAVMLYRNRPRR